MSAASFTLTNAQVLAGEGDTRGTRVYRELVAAHGHDALCTAYGLDVDAVDGGTHWVDVVRQAVFNGDVDLETLETT